MPHPAMSNDYQGTVYPNCKFQDPGAGVLMWRRGHTSHYSEYVLSSTISIYSTLIAVVLRDYDAAILYPLLIFIFSLMGLLIYKYEPFWQEVNVTIKVSDTQVTVKACGPLVFFWGGGGGGFFVWFFFFLKIFLLVFFFFLFFFFF